MATSLFAGPRIATAAPPIEVQVGSVFNSEGPGPATGPRNLVGSADSPPTGTAVGAIQAIVVDPSNPNILYVGAVDGGIWKSTNGGSSWLPLIDQKASISISSLALDPTDATHKTLVAGTGDLSNGGFRSISIFSTPGNFGGLQNGLLYSKDGGASWSRIGETALSGQSVIDVTAHGATILAATFEARVLGASAFTGGLFRSTDSGATFTAVSGAGGSGLPSGPVTSLVGDPANPNTYYAAVTASSAGTRAQTAVYKSTDGGATWTAVFAAAQSGGLINAANQTTFKIATGPGGTLAIGLVNLGTGKINGLFYSNTAGASWTTLTAPAVNGGGQAPLNFSLAIDPTSSNLVYVMGDNNFSTNGGINALSIVRVNATTNTATSLTDDNGVPTNTGNGSTVHPDGRALAFDSNGRLLVSNDGGIYVRTLPATTTGVWQGLNGSIAVSEIYGLGYDSNSHRLVISAQDNGSSYQAAPGSKLFNQRGSGDGINAVVNDGTLTGLSAIYTNFQNLGGLQRFIVNSTGTIVSPETGPFFAPGTPVTFNIPVANRHFTSPLVLNNIDPTRIAVGGSHVYVTQDTLTGANAPSAVNVNLTLTDLGATGTFITTIDYGTRNNTNAVLAGGGLFNNPAGRVFFSATAAAGSLVTPLAAYTGLAPTSVKFDLRSDQRFFVADSQNLFGTVNQGAAFTSLTANLPANFIRPTALAFVDNNGVDAVLVGGLNNADNVGNPLVVADSDAAGNLSGWRRLGTGLPNTTVNALVYNARADTLALSSIGRGAFLLYDFTSNFASATVLQFGLAGNSSTPDPAILSGNRPVIAFGPGTLTITGPSTYTGATTVLSGAMVAAAANVFAPSSAFTVASLGTLNLGGFNQTIGSLAGAGLVTLGAGNLTTGGNNSSTTFSGVISGAGALVKAGSGTFTLSGANTYTGGTQLNAGALSISADNNLGTGLLAMSQGTSLQFTSSFTFTHPTTISGDPTFDVPAGLNVIVAAPISDGALPGTLEKTSAGTLTLAAPATYTGATNVLSGSLTAAAANVFAPSSAFTVAPLATLNLNGFNQTVGSLAGAGQVTLGAGNLTTGGNNGSTAFSGVVSGSGGLVKAGSGTLMLAGASTYSGATLVNAGTLALTGSIANSPVIVAGGATLAGGGTIGGLAVLSAGTVAPGALTPYSTMAVNGNIAFAAGSIFIVNLAATGQTDAIAATGAAMLAGGTVQVIPASGVYTPASRFRILSALGGVTGTFAQLAISGAAAQTFAFLMPSLIYDASSVTVGFARAVNAAGAPILFSSLAQTPNQAATAAAAEALGLGNPLFNALVGLSQANAPLAFDALSGEAHASAVTAAFADSGLVRSAILNRLAGPPALAGCPLDKTIAGTPATPPSGPRLSCTYELWGQGFGNWGRTSSTGNTAALSRSTGGFVIGGDVGVENTGISNLRLGLAGGYTSDELKVNSRNSSGRFESIFGVLYGSAGWGNVTIRGGAAIGGDRTSVSRRVQFPNFYDATSANYGGTIAQAFGEAGYRFGFGMAGVEPIVGLAAIRVHQNSFAESGGPAALTGLSRDTDFGVTTLGLRGDFALADTLSLRGLLAWRHAFGDTSPSILALFRGSAAPFRVSGAPVDRDAAAVEIGFSYAAKSGLRAGLTYAGQIGRRAQDHAVKLNLGVAF